MYGRGKANRAFACVILFLAATGGCKAVEKNPSQTGAAQEAASANSAAQNANQTNSPAGQLAGGVPELLAGKEGLFAVFETSRGDIVVELFYKQAPLTVTNFVGLAEGTLDAAKGQRFYDGTLFHRVISKANGDTDDFMIQGGDPQSKDPALERRWGTGGPNYTFPDEFDPALRHDRPGRLSMANSGAGQNGQGTNGSQFFITIVPTPHLDDRHTIFGQVIQGQNIVDSIKQKDKLNRLTIIRKGSEAEQFKAAQAEWNALAESAKRSATQRFAEEQKKAQELARLRTGSEAAARQFLPGAQVSPEGILYKTTKEGAGQPIGKGKNVQTHYTGYFLTKDVFDSSSGREPLAFVTGAGQMISGYDKMVQTMKVGEKRTVVLPPAEAYGSRGAGGVIPPNAYLCFDIEVVSAR
jgi:cyclophilin family peptidyl-prolyl cis-trans isomerase